MVNKLIIISVFLLFSSSLVADEVTVFYNANQTIQNESIVKKNGHKLLFLQMDLLEELQHNHSKKININHQKTLAEIFRIHGFEKLIAMKSDERALLVLRHFNNIGVDLHGNALSDINNKELQRAVKILRFANEQGVTQDMLPAVIFKGNLYRNVTNYGFLFNGKNQ